MSVSRGGVRSPARAHLELILARKVNDSENNFYRYTSSKWKRRENVSPQLNKVGNLVTRDTEESEVLVPSPQPLLQRFAFRNHGPETTGNFWSKNDLLLVDEEKARNI